MSGRSSAAVALSSGLSALVALAIGGSAGAHPDPKGPSVVGEYRVRLVSVRVQSLRATQAPKRARGQVIEGEPFVVYLRTSVRAQTHGQQTALFGPIPLKIIRSGGDKGEGALASIDGLAYWRVDCTPAEGVTARVMGGAIVGSSRETSETSRSSRDW